MNRSTTLLAAALAATAAVPLSAAEAAQPTFGSRVLELGMRGHDVRVLQDFLGQAGFIVNIDGRFGPATRRRVRAWERREALTVDGRVTKRDAQLLRRALASAGGAGGAQYQALPRVQKATIAADGTAVAPSGAPEPVKRIIAAANEIHSKPYKYGGGHGNYNDSGYDCSGSMSYALHGADLLDEALDSSGFMSYGEAGKGRWVTIYAHGGHAYMVVAGLRFDTSGRKERGSRWTTDMRSSRGYRLRHIPGL